MGIDDTTITPTTCALIVHRLLRLTVFLFGAREDEHRRTVFSLVRFVEHLKSFIFLTIN